MSRSKKLTKDEKDAINRQNAQKSTGPKTEEGKDASRKNSTKHGCRAAVIPPPDEDPGLEQQRIAEWVAEYKPFTPRAHAFVAAAARASVHAERADRHHQRLLKKQEEDEGTPADGLLTDPRAASLMLRYATEAARALRRASDEMERIMAADRVAREAAEVEAKQRAAAVLQAEKALKYGAEMEAYAKAPPNEPDGSPCKDPDAHYNQYMRHAMDWRQDAVKLMVRSGQVKHEAFLGGDPVEALPPHLERLVTYNWL